MFRKRPATVQPYPALDPLRQQIETLRERNYALENRLLGLDHRVMVTDAVHRDQLELAANRNTLHTLETQLKELEKQEAEAHAKRGEELATRYRQQLLAILDQRQAALATVADIEAQHKDATQMATAELREYPMHLAAMADLLPKYEDEMTRLLDAVIALRKMLLDTPDIFALIEKTGASAYWFKLNLHERADFEGINLQEVEEWLRQYRQRKANL